MELLTSSAQRPHTRKPRHSCAITNTVREKRHTHTHVSLLSPRFLRAPNLEHLGDETWAFDAEGLRSRAFGCAQGGVPLVAPLIPGGTIPGHRHLCLIASPPPVPKHTQPCSHAQKCAPIKWQHAAGSDRTLVLQGCFFTLLYILQNRNYKWLVVFYQVDASIIMLIQSSNVGSLVTCKFLL